MVAALSQGSGFTPGFASRLELADGRRVFVKAADPRFGWLVEAYRTEAHKLARLPAAVSAPRLQALVEQAGPGGSWLILLFDDVAGAPPTRPWSLAQARAALAEVGRISRLLTPPPAGAAWTVVADGVLEPAHDWKNAAAANRWRRHLVELDTLASRRFELLAGETLSHLDLRDDNVIFDAAGRVWVCDWNFPAVGPRWFDAACLAISMRGDGLDADALLAETGLLGPADGEGLDCALACLTLYFLLTAAQPDNPSSPYLRIHQRWYAQATGDWLCQRLGW